MTVTFQEQTSATVAGARPSAATSEAEGREAAQMSASEVIERVNSILGYDMFEAELMAQGYAELGGEMLRIAESTITAQAETLSSD
jgi:hypothetical protein